MCCAGPVDGRAGVLPARAAGPGGGARHARLPHGPGPGARLHMLSQLCQVGLLVLPPQYG
jgi:hypothetical protein